MNQQNFDYLKETLKYTGFGEGLNDRLEKGLRSGEANFQLTFETEIGRKAFAAVLNFRKGDNTDLYFFNSYHASLQRSNGEVLDQVFYMNKGRGVTAKEAFNLLEGRAVQKELTTKDGQTYKAWIQIDFEKKDRNNHYEMRQFHESYGYNLQAELNRFPIFEMTQPDLKDILLASLQRGNLQAVSIEKDGGISRMFIEASPQYKTINLYDGQLRRVPKESLDQYLSPRVDGTKEVKQGIKETTGLIEKRNDRPTGLRQKP